MQRAAPATERVSSLDFEKQFKGKVCLVTGATSGIGKCVCRRLLRAGNILMENLPRSIRNHDRTHNAKNRESDRRI